MFFFRSSPSSHTLRDLSLGEYFFFTCSDRLELYAGCGLRISIRIYSDPLQPFSWAPITTEQTRRIFVCLVERMVATTLRFILLTTGFVINPLVYAFRPAAVPRHLVYRRFVARLRSSPTFNGCNDGISSKSLDESNAYSSDYSEVPLSNVPVLEVEGRAMFPGNRDVLLVYELAWLDFFQRLLSLGAYGEMPTSPLIISAATSKPKPKIPPCSVSQSTGPVAALTAKNGRGIFYSHFLRGERVGVVMRVLDYRELDNGATLLVCAQAVARVAIPDSQDIQRLPRVPGSKLLMSPGGTVSLALMHDDEEVAAAALTLASSDDASSFTQSNIDATSGDSKNGESDNHDDSTLYPSADVATGAWCAAWANFDIPPFVETPRWYLRGIDALAPMACAPSSSEDRDAQLAAAEATTRTAADVARAAYSKAPQHRGSASEVFTKDSKDRSAESTGIADEATESMLTSLAEVEAAVWAELET